MIRTLKECDRYDPENIEFTLSLLDRRFIAGDHSLYQILQNKRFPKSHCANGAASCIDLPNWPAGGTKNTATLSSISNPISKSVRAVCAITNWPIGSTCCTTFANIKPGPPISETPSIRSTTTLLRRLNFLAPHDAFCTSAAAAMTTASIGMRRTKPRRRVSVWKPRAPPIPRTGCGRITAMPVRSTAVPSWPWRPCHRHGSLSTGPNDANAFLSRARTLWSRTAASMSQKLRCSRGRKVFFGCLPWSRRMATG